MLEANLDDMNPQLYGYFAERALEAGALDVFSTPVQMKKNRPGQLVTVLCAPADKEKFSDLLFRETTTLGVRQSHVKRRTLQRESITVETSFGAVRMKIARLNWAISQRCARIRGLPAARGRAFRPPEASSGRSHIPIPKIKWGREVDGNGNAKS